MERDIVRARKDAELAKQREADLFRTLRIYFPDSVLLREATVLDARVAASPGSSTPVSLDSFSIVEACEVVLRELSNQWLSLADLDMELKRHEKICTKGSIEIKLKESRRFEVEKRGKKNFYRLRSSEDVADSRTTK